MMRGATNTHVFSTGNQLRLRGKTYLKNFIYGAALGTNETEPLMLLLLPPFIGPAHSALRCSCSYTRCWDAVGTDERVRVLSLSVLFFAGAWRVHSLAPYFLHLQPLFVLLRRVSGQPGSARSNAHPRQREKARKTATVQQRLCDHGREAKVLLRHRAGVGRHSIQDWEFLSWVLDSRG